jgi:hypothetical protein
VDYGDSVLYNDKGLLEQAQASRKAARNWRFRNVGRTPAKVLGATWRAIGQAVRAPTKPVLASVRRRRDQVRDWPSETALEQR